MAETGQAVNRDGGRGRRIAVAAILPVMLILAGIAVAVALLLGRQDGPGKAGVDLHPVVADGKWGYIDAKGVMVIRPQWDDAGEFSEGLAAVRSGEAWGIVDAAGSVIAKPAFEKVGLASGGLVRVLEAGRWGYLDRKGAKAIAPAFDAAMDFSEERAAIMKGGKWGFVDTRGRTVIEPRYEAAGKFSAGIARVAVATAGGDPLWGFVDARGREVAKPSYAHAGDVEDGLVRVKICKPGEAWCSWRFLDAKARPAFDREFEWAWDFSEGLAAVLVDGRWGYVDTLGNLVVQPSYADAGSFAGGLARVKIGGRWGYIDATGKAVIAPRFHEASDFDGSLAAVSYVTRKPGSVMEPLLTAAGYVDRSGRYVWNPPPPDAPRPDQVPARVMWNYDFLTGKIRVIGSFDATTYEIKFREEAGSFTTIALDLPDPLETGAVRDVVAGENYTLVVTDNCVAFSLGWAAILAGETALVKTRTEDGEILRNVIVTWLPAGARGGDLAAWTVSEDGFFLVSAKGRVYHGSAADPLAPLDEFDLGTQPLPSMRLLPRDGMLFLLQPGSKFLVARMDEKRGWLSHTLDLGWEAMATPTVEEDAEAIILRDGGREARLVAKEIAARISAGDPVTAPE